MEAAEKDVANIQLRQVLHMNGGDGDNSYANNSLLQKKVMLQAKPILQESIVELCNNNFSDCITFADMGCSSGPNNFLLIWEIMEAIDGICKRLNRKPPMLQMFLNDLPGNDFNSIFRSLPSFYKKHEEDKRGWSGHCFVAAMPGSFYGRLFPPRALHFVHASYSLHWCSELPKTPINKGNIYPTITSAPGVHKAYVGQFEKDFTAFLTLRSEELVAGGGMVLTFLGSDENNDSSSKYGPFILEVFGITLNDMVSEGLIEESKLDSFNMPLYAASAEEIKKVIEVEGSFKINRLESFHLGWDASIDDCYKDSMDKYTKGYHVANHLRAVGESILASHFGGEIIDAIFQRFSIKVADYMELVNCAYTNHVVSMTKE